MWNIVRYLKAMWGLFNMCLVVEHLSVGQKASKHKHKCWKTLNYVRHCYPPHILSCTFTDFILSFLSILCYKWTMYYYFFNFHFILCVAFNLPRQPSDCISSRLQCFFPLLTRIKQFDGVNMSVRNKRWSGYWNDHSSYWDGKFVPGPLKQTRADWEEVKKKWLSVPLETPLSIYLWRAHWKTKDEPICYV